MTTAAPEGFDVTSDDIEVTKLIEDAIATLAKMLERRGLPRPLVVTAICTGLFNYVARHSGIAGAARLFRMMVEAAEGVMVKKN